MFCPKCGTQQSDDYKFCSKCGAQMPTIVQEPEKPVEKPANQKTVATPPTVPTPPTPSAAPAPATDSKAKAPQPQTTKTPPAPPVPPAPHAPKPPRPDVKNIVKSPLKVMAVKGAVDFKAAEHAIESEGLKMNAFSGFFSKPHSTEIRVESLTKIYEPIHMVRAVYEGSFEIKKNFMLQMDPGTVKVVIDKNEYEVKQVTPSGGLFNSTASPSIKLAGTETVKKRVEKGLYYDLNGVQKNQIEQYITGKKTVAFDPQDAPPRSQVLGTHFDPSHLVDKVLTPDIAQRPQNADKTINERITVDVQTIYYPKYKALVTNLKNNQQKYIIFSAVNKAMFPTETF